jgi:hypothetical protein
MNRVNNSITGSTSLGVPPRQVVLKLENWLTTLLLGAFVAVFVFLVGYISGNAALALITLFDGDNVPGKVTGHQVTPRHSYQKGDYNVYSLKYGFELGGEHFSGQQDVEPKLYKTLKDQSTISVRVVPSLAHFYNQVIFQPPLTSAQLKDLEQNLWYALILSPLLLIIPLIPVFQGLRKKRLTEIGVECPGVIISKYMQGGKYIKYYLLYRYNFQSQSFEGTGCLSQERWELAKVDDGVTVLYDPDKPQSSICYECSPFEVSK